MITQWEYKFVLVEQRENVADVLNQAGQEGWEFAGEVNKTNPYWMYLMKRPCLDQHRGNNDPKPPRPEGDDPRAGNELLLPHQSELARWARVLLWIRRNPVDPEPWRSDEDS